MLLNWLPKLKMFNFEINLNIIKATKKKEKKRKERTKQTPK